MSRLNPARLLAVQVGAAARKRSAFVSDVLDARLPQVDLSPEDRAFARALCLGVAATWGTLDDVIDYCLRSSRDVQPDVRDALRVSTYEIVFMDKAGHAAVDQGVELVRSVQPKAANLANAVLRKMILAKCDFPFGDPAVDDAAFARLYGFPLWMAQLFIQQLGRKRAAEYMVLCNQQAPVFFAINAVKADETQVVQAFAQNGLLLQPVRLSVGGEVVPGCYHASETTMVASRTARELFDSGRILVSDAAAQCVAHRALPPYDPGDFLEVGSGRGTKTILMQSEALRRYGHQVEWTAIDSHGFKDEILRRRAKVYGIRLDDALKVDACDLSAVFGSRVFGAAFIDVPCTGLGTLRRHPEIRWKLRSHEVESMAAQGYRMLDEVSKHVVVGGQLTYATCTVSAEENEYVIKRFLGSEAGANYKIVPCSVNGLSKLFMKTPLTADGCDAHFAACLRRIQ